MAKQRGIHQISGKVNNLVYYEQKRVPVGLIRRQNEAMSGRLKTDPAFAQTRKAGAEFGYCSNTAASIIRSIPLRAQRIIDPFINPLFTKYLFNILKQQEGVFGQRYFEISKTLGENIEAFINRQSKLQWQGVMPSVNVPWRLDAGVTTISLTLDRLEILNFCETYGYDGIRFSFYDQSGTTFGEVDQYGKYTKTLTASYREAQRILYTPQDSGDLTQELMLYPGFSQYQSIIIMAEPMKLIGGAQTYPREHKCFIYKSILYGR